MDKLNKILENLKVKIADYFKDDATGHNIGHLERTLKYALYLQQNEGGDKIVIGISAYIHDIHRILSTKQNRYVSPKESLPTVEEFIKDLDITSEQKKHILSAIEHHEEYNFTKEGVLVSDKESLILQDADNLDAIGAMGIVRTLKYGIAHGQAEYDPNTPLYQVDNYDESHDDASSIHHINNKLVRLGKYMNTNTAKALAITRTKLMNDFVKAYIDEYNSIIEQ